MGADEGRNNLTDFTSNFYASENKRNLGTYYHQRFYAVRAVPGKELTLPFAPQHFNALIHVAKSQPEAALHSTVHQLLRYGLRSGLCHGRDAERLSQIFDGLVDEHGFAPDGGTAYSVCHGEEPLNELVEYFILPNGLAGIGLIVVLGEDEDFEAVLETFEQVTGALHQQAEELCREPAGAF